MIVILYCHVCRLQMSAGEVDGVLTYLLASTALMGSAVGARLSPRSSSNAEMNGCECRDELL